MNRLFDIPPDPRPPMKDCTRRLFAKLADMTGAKCAACPGGSPYRCCDPMFCRMNAEHAAAMARPLTADQPGVGGIPYMGARGCVLDPADRPYCTGYVCPPHYADRQFRREYDRLLSKIARDPGAPPMPQIMARNRADLDDDARATYEGYLL